MGRVVGHDDRRTGEPTQLLPPVDIELKLGPHQVAQPDDLHDLDEQRVLAPNWFQDPATLGYATYVDRYAGTLTGVGERLDHLQQLGVTYLHLLPLLQPRPAPHDGGYAVQDYRAVRADLGTMEDLRALTGRLRERTGR